MPDTFKSGSGGASGMVYAHPATFLIAGVNQLRPLKLATWITMHDPRAICTLNALSVLITELQDMKLNIVIKSATKAHPAAANPSNCRRDAF